MAVTRLDPVASDQPVRRRVAAALGLALLAVVAGLAHLLTYDPLASGNGSFAAGRESAGTLIADQVTSSPERGLESLTIVDPAVDSRFGVSFGLVNSGRWPVEVLDVQLSVADTYFADRTAFVAATAAGATGPYVAFTPFALGSEQSRDVGVSYRLRGCPDGPGNRSVGTLRFPDVEVTWRVAGLTRVSRVALGYEARLSGLPQCAAG